MDELADCTGLDKNCFFHIFVQKCLILTRRSFAPVRVEGGFFSQWSAVVALFKTTVIPSLNINSAGFEH